MAEAPPGWRPLPIGWLTRPLPLAGLALMALNDHVLRVRWPNPLTFKLSDFAVLWFLPALLCALWNLAQVALGREGALNRVQVIVSSALAGLVLALLNLAPPARDLYLALLEGLTGSPHTYVCDPSDCLALATLPLVLWDGSRALKPSAPSE